jgi:long-chain-fatty-acid--[acyl-carrier-protein] ligase
LNRYLESFYNAEPLPRNTRVPYYFWQGSTPVELPEPVRSRRSGRLEEVPAATREIVTGFLRELSGKPEIGDADHLGDELGLDSLARAEVLAWLSAEFGYPPSNVDALQTAGDVLLAACGEAVSGGPTQLQPVPAKWFAPAEDGRLRIPAGETITRVFLEQANRHPGRTVVADQSSGGRTYRDLVTGIFVLRPELMRLPGQHVGVMLPASVTAVVVYLALLFARKTPVMINWTVGWRSLGHSLDLVGAERVLTAKALVSRVESHGTDLSGVRDRFLYLEDLAGGITRSAKLRGWLRARLTRGRLAKVRPTQVAAVIFTSGSESLPKAVPLTHANLLTNLRDVTSVTELHGTDRLLGMLPPFHSFGLTGNILLSICAGVPTVYHPNPTEGATLARLIAAYRVTITIGTPTFLHGILRAGSREQLSSLRLAVTGAEECPPRVYAAAAERCPHAVLLEGYGITECSPIVSLNDERAPRAHTIGRVLPSVRHAIVGIETGEAVSAGTTGMLLLSGPTVFAGYVGDAPSPFIDYGGTAWYRTGDLVSEDEEGVLTFRGRLKRFVKIGGEMISLPAIESVLANAFGGAEEDGPALAVIDAADADRPELVLASTREISRDDANQRLRSAGLSPLHHVRRTVQVEAIPVLGTGKTDYRALQEMVKRMQRESPGHGLHSM